MRVRPWECLVFSPCVNVEMVNLPCALCVRKNMGYQGNDKLSCVPCKVVNVNVNHTNLFVM